MTLRVPTYNFAKHVAPGGTSAREMVRLAAPFLGLCAAWRHIGMKTVPLYAPLALLMERIAAHFGRFSTNEPTIEPTKTQEIDERTQESDERTRDSANEPEVRLVAPAAPNPHRCCDSAAGADLAVWLPAVGSNPRRAIPPNDPGPHLTSARLSAIIPTLRAMPWRPRRPKLRPAPAGRPTFAALPGARRLGHQIARGLGGAGRMV
jgi:hypothetical protein